MNDSPMTYEMLNAIAAQVSQELYREAQSASAPSRRSHRDTLAKVRTWLAGGKECLVSGCDDFARPTRIQEIHL